MLIIDPASLIITNGLMSLALAAVLLVSRIGLGREAAGIRTWVLADLALSAARIAAAATIAGLPWAQGLVFPVLPGCLAVLGLVGHVHAVRSVAGRPVRPAIGFAQAAGLAVLFYLVTAPIESLTVRMRWFDATILCGAAVMLWTLWPQLRFWGARLIATMMVLALLFQGLRFGALLAGIDIELPPEAAVSLRTSVKPGTLVIDLIIALFVTGGFALLMQERLRARIERLVVTDALTGALNRHGLMPLASAAVAQALRHQRPLSVVMFDLDHFKRVNDEHGHATGDQVLAAFSAAIGAQLRSSDALARWGGEEFLLLLPDTDLGGAGVVADRLREAVAQEPLAAGVPQVTVSAGVASFSGAPLTGRSDAARSLLQLLDTADRRLYLAKRRRNCVVIDEDKAHGVAYPGGAGDAQPPSECRRSAAIEPSFLNPTTSTPSARSGG